MRAVALTILLLSPRQFFDESIPGLRYDDPPTFEYEQFQDDERDWLELYDVPNPVECEDEVTT